MESDHSSRNHGLEEPMPEEKSSLAKERQERLRKAVNYEPVDRMWVVPPVLPGCKCARRCAY